MYVDGKSNGRQDAHETFLVVCDIVTCDIRNVRVIVFYDDVSCTY